MYRNQYDGRLARSLEAAVLILESFSRLARKEKYRIDLVGHSGEEPVIPLVPVDELAQLHAGDFFKVIQKVSGAHDGSFLAKASTHSSTVLSSFTSGGFGPSILLVR